MTYTNATAKEAECHDCGETKDCEIYIATSPEGETGYVDEVALCAECRKFYRKRD